MREKVKAPVPSKADKPVMGLKTEKDFVKANVTESTAICKCVCSVSESACE